MQSESQISEQVKYRVSGGNCRNVLENYCLIVLVNLNGAFYVNRFRNKLSYRIMANLSFSISSDFLIYETAELEKEMKYFQLNKNFKANFIKPKLRSWMDGRILKKIIS